MAFIKDRRVGFPYRRSVGPPESTRFAQQRLSKNTRTVLLGFSRKYYPNSYQQVIRGCQAKQESWISFVFMHNRVLENRQSSGNRQYIREK